MSFVLDASFAAAWVMEEEHSAVVERIVCRISDHASVPPLFWDETRNIVLTAERRSRIAAGEAIAAMDRLRRLSLVTIDVTGDGEILRLASTHRLSAYDAGYLDIAISTQRPLATLDRLLAQAAKASRVEVLGPYA